jgi:hypothetical protein
MSPLVPSDVGNEVNMGQAFTLRHQIGVQKAKIEFNRTTMRHWSIPFDGRGRRPRPFGRYA